MSCGLGGGESSAILSSTGDRDGCCREDMHAVLLPNGGLRFAAIFSPTMPTLPKCTIYDREFADGISRFASNGGLLQSSGSNIRCKENRRSRPNTSLNKTGKENDKLKETAASDGKTSKASSQKEIIDLFRRIQTSISKGGSTVSKKRISRNSKEKLTAGSVLGALQQSPKSKQRRGDREDKTPPRRGASEDETKEVAAVPGDFKPSRPLSSFVKRSPIPQPTPTKEDPIKEVEEQSSTVTAEEISEMQKLDNMKLPELKELARSKGVKGYSKLKKGELLELLKGVLHSS